MIKFYVKIQLNNSHLDLEPSEPSGYQRQDRKEVSAEEVVVER